MPLVTLHVPESLAPDRVAAVSEAVHEALVATVNIPATDRFHVIHRHDATTLIIDPDFPGVQRSGEAVIITIALRIGRTDDQKTALFAEVARLVRAKADIRPDDVMIVLNENTSMDWSFARGVAHYARPAALAGPQ